MPSRARILLADDHCIFRLGLDALLRAYSEWEIVDQASNGPEALRLIDQLHPDVAILDIKMPGVGGVEILKEIRAKGAKTRVLFLSECSENSLLYQLAQQKPDGYILKSENANEIIQGLITILQGGFYFSPGASLRFLEALAAQSKACELNDDTALTEREWDVARCVSLGMSNKEIAREIGCSEHTVKAHKTSVMKKLKVSNAAGIAAWFANTVRDSTKMNERNGNFERCL